MSSSSSRASNTITHAHYYNDINRLRACYEAAEAVAFAAVGRTVASVPSTKCLAAIRGVGGEDEEAGEGVSGSSCTPLADVGVDGVTDSSAVAYDTYELARDSALNGSVGGGLKDEGGTTEGMTGVTEAVDGPASGEVVDVVGADSSGIGSSAMPGGEASAGELWSVDSATGKLSVVEPDAAEAPLPVRACDASGEGPALSVEALVTLSKSGGGTRSALDVDAANAMASAPYGTPNRPSDSLLEMSLIWSGVGPDLG
ncbi:hypothetical protein PUNSTDRAFT_41683 [Punctularia strigosozonata HHB-11173 SS5]|uniref:uncharacterized protein n=1 Tax=Punctularia strigosozonata (strain HHB-11173) TaxID=741275 RepID=UPI0004416D5C|nr:uncharacterized protein PUNSTDRAFT_41683 [Punctularia strigosozonata HHB-11173 SS5]EIN14484.1 hypothetical protein PUNSTDRAFT_41683 [Punctularia strigosozonata HHB-11173 SS5]